MQIDSEFSFNTVVWISSLPADEQGPSRRMLEELESLSKQMGFSIRSVKVGSAAELANLLNELAILASGGKLRPLLHFDMHGSKESGLLISGSNEHVPWEILGEFLRNLNISTGNNLCVVGAACFGLQAIKTITLTQPTPFFVLLAPEDEVSVGFLETSVPAFYKELFLTGSIDSAHSHNLFDSFKYFHCEKMLCIVLARYIRLGCKGKSAQERRERLLSEVFSQGVAKTRQSLRDVRRKIKEGTRPNQALLDRYVSTFLINKPCGFSMEDLLALLDEEDA